MPTAGGKSDKATLSELQRPETLSKQLAQSNEDCLSCRLLGSAAFTGLGVYMYVSGQNQLAQQQAKIIASGTRFGMRARRNGITALSAMLVGMGLYRLVN